MTDKKDKTKSNLVYLNTLTDLPIPPNQVLDLTPRTLKEVVVVGVDENDLMYYASSEPELPKVLWLLKKMEQAVLKPDYLGEDDED